MPSGFSVVAIIAAHNEADVIEHVVRDLVTQNIQVYFLDDGSTDATSLLVEHFVGHGVIAVERLSPPDQSAKSFDWAGILARKAQLSAELDADWFIHHDADEFRHQADREQVVVEVDGIIVAHGRRDNRRAGIGKQKRVAVRIRLDDLARPDDAGASRLVLDDDRLAEFRPQAFRYDAGHQIGRSAGRERRYQGDLPRWIIFLRDRRRGESGQEQNRKASQHVTIPPAGTMRPFGLT